MIQKLLKANTKQILIVATISIIVLAVFIPFEIYLRAKQGVGHQTGNIKIAGIKAPVKISRDKLGIPYIEAKSRDDLFIATGYATAQDRLWQMTMLKMAASGRLSEILGPKLLDVDIYIRSIGLARNAIKAYKALEPGEKHILEQYARGVNAYTSQNKLPIEFVLADIKPEQWQAVDCMIVFSMANFQLSGNLKEELAFLKLAARTGPDKAALLFPIYPDEPLPLKHVAKLHSIQADQLDQIAEAAHQVMRNQKLLARSLDPLRELDSGIIPASNNWAVSKNLAKGKKSIIANDTHLLITVPSFWAIMHLKAPGYEAAGVMIPGVPIVALGFNGHIAWGATMMIADSQDIFIEKIRNHNNKTEYLYKGKWRAVQSFEEKIRIKGQSKEYRFNIQHTVHGPLLNQALERNRISKAIQPAKLKSSYGLALRWSLADGERGLRGLYQMGQARSIQNARDAFSKIDTMYLNIVYGDENHIAWQTTGRIPIRKKGRGLFPSPGWSGQYDWDGYLAFEKKPFSIDPEKGWLGTANHRTIPPDFKPSIGSSWVGPWRYNRIEEMLQKKKNIDSMYIHKMHADRNSTFARRLIRFFKQPALAQRIQSAIHRIPDQSDKDKTKLALEMLVQYNGNLLPNSNQAALLGAFYQSFTRNTFFDEPEFARNKELFFDSQPAYSASMDHLLIDRRSPYYDNHTTKNFVETRADMIVQSLLDAWNFCLKEQSTNPEEWEWGKFHKYYWKHQLSHSVPILGTFLDLGPDPAGGDTTTLNVAAYKWGRNFTTTWIPAMRLVVDFSKADPAMLITHTGQSGNPASDHYQDMRPYFLKVKNHNLPFSAKNISNQYTKELKLLPK